MYGSHIAPHPKQHRKKADSERSPQNTKIAPRAHPESARGHPQGAANGTHKEASRAQKNPRKQYSGALAVPKCSKTHTLATSQRQEKTHPKLPKASQRAPKEGPMRPTGAQESSKRGSKGPQGHPRESIVAPGPPKMAPKWRLKGEQKRVEKATTQENTRISLLHTIYHTWRTSDTPENHRF